MHYRRRNARANNAAVRTESLEIRECVGFLPGAVVGRESALESVRNARWKHASKGIGQTARRKSKYARWSWRFRTGLFVHDSALLPLLPGRT